MSEERQCLICKNNHAIIDNSVGGRDSFSIKCQVCGDYEISRTLYVNLGSPKEDLYILSGVIKEATAHSKILHLFTDNIDALIKNANVPKSIIDKVDRMLLYFEDRTQFHGYDVKIDSAIDYPLIFARNAIEFNSLIESCIELNYLKHNNENSPYYQLSLKGSQRIDELKKGGFVNPQLVFMAMKFNDTLQEPYYKYFQEAVKQTGFILRRLDEEQPSGLIDNRLRVEIRNCRFLLADVTNENRGAYWEAGFAEGLGKSVIFLCHTKDFDRVHFDTNHQTIIKWDENSIDSAMKNLKATIRATFPSEAIMEDEK